MPTIIISPGSIVSGCAVRGRELDSYLPTSLGAVPGAIPFSRGAFTHRSPIDRDVVDNHSCPDFPRRTNLDSRRSSAAPGRSDRLRILQERAVPHMGTRSTTGFGFVSII